MGVHTIRDLGKPHEILLIIISFLYCFVLLILSANERVEMNSGTSIRESSVLSSAATAAISNIITDPIISIELQRVADGKACSDEVINVYTWETVYKYCDCGDSITRKFCSRSSSCKNRTRKTLPMSNWQGNRFCVKRLQPDEWDFQTMKGGNCPKNFHLCRGGICVKNSVQICPITELIISVDKPSTSGFTYTAISDFPGNRTVYISRDKEKTVLTTLIAQIDVPCIDVQTGPLRKDGGVFSIIEVEPNGCNAHKDYGVDADLYILLDVSLEWKFYEENPHLDYFLSLPGYRSFVGDQKISLYARSKIVFDEQKLRCGSFDFSSLKSMSTDLGWFERSHRDYNIITFLMGSLVIVLIFNYFLIRLSESYKKFCCQIFEGNLSSIVGLGFALSLAVIITLGIASNSMDSFDDNTLLLRELGESKCFKLDAYNRIFEDFKTVALGSFEIGKPYHSPALGLSITYFIISFFYLTYMVIMWLCKKFNK